MILQANKLYHSTICAVTDSISHLPTGGFYSNYIRMRNSATKAPAHGAIFSQIPSSRADAFYQTPADWNQVAVKGYDNKTKRTASSSYLRKSVGSSRLFPQQTAAVSSSLHQYPSLFSNSINDIISSMMSHSSLTKQDSSLTSHVSSAKTPESGSWKLVSILTTMNRG